MVEAVLRAERPTLSGARLGMLGLGNIGMKIAQRATAFGMSIAYCTRNPRPELRWRHYADAIALARRADHAGRIVQLRHREQLRLRILANHSRDWPINTARGAW